MPSVVNKIDITYVQTTAAEEGKGVRLEITWKLNKGMSCSYAGDYIASLYADGERRATAGFTDDLGRCRQILVFQEEKKKNAFYEISLGIPKEAGGIVSDPVCVLLDTYENVKGEYDGKRMFITWDRQADSIAEGVCRITTGHGASFLRKIEPYAWCLVDEAFYMREDDWFTATLYPLNQNMQGPGSQSLTFYGGTVKCTGVEHCLGSNGKICIDVQIEQDMPCEEYQMVISDGRTDLYAQNAKPEKSKLSMELDTAVIAYASLGRYQLKIYPVSARAVSKTEKEGISLAVPKVDVKRIAPEMVKAKLDMPRVEAFLEYEVLCGEQILRTTEGQCEIHCKEGETLRAAAVFYHKNGRYRGSYSEPSDGFQRGYYPLVDGSGKLCIRLLDKQAFQGKIRIAIHEKLFQTEKAVDLVKGPAALKGEGQSYILEVDAGMIMPREDYRLFIQKIRDDMTPEGFYLLTELLFRTLPQKYEDSMYFLCGYEPERRCVDVRPGTIVQADIQSYLFLPLENRNVRNGLELGNEQGFTASCSMRYRPVLNEAGYLVFNGFLEQIAGYMNVTETGQENIIEAAGIGDLSLPALRQPYFSILYPLEMQPSHLVHSMYLSDNVAMLASENYGKIQDTVDFIIEHPAVRAELDISAVIFRGRSMLSLLIEVEVNGKQRSVPVGTTMGQLVSQMGVLLNPKIEMYRRSEQGTEVPVFWSWMKGAEHLPLAPGDRLVI